MPFASKLPEIVAALPAAVRQAALDGAQLIAANAQQRCPYDANKPASQPHLRDAIHVEEVPDGAEVLAGDGKVFWGNFVEHGTVNAPPHPFLIPALEENRERVTEIVRDAVHREAGS